MNQKRAAALGSLSVLAMAAGTALYQYENNSIQVTKLRMNAEITSPLRIVLLSDLHGKEFGRSNERLIRKVTECAPDLIAVTGDLVNGNASSREILRMTELLEKLNSLVPVFYVSGNHEHRLADLEFLRDALRRRGITVLVNEMVSFRVNEQQVTVLGIDEDENDQTDRHVLMRDFELQDGFRLLLCHYPDRFALNGEESYQNYCFDLMLAGHAHGGQLVLPGIGGLYAPGQGFFPKYYRGMYGEIPKLVVSRGLGPSSFPTRLCNRPEIVSIEVEPSLPSEESEVY